MQEQNFIITFMKEFLSKQCENRFFWVPILLAFGAALYFIMPNEPNISHPVLAFITGMIILLFGKMDFILRSAMLFLCGFLYAVFYTQFLVSTPVLKYDVRDTTIIAQVTDIDISENKTKLILSVPANDLRINSEQNANIKVSILNNKDVVQIGDTIHAKGSIFAPYSMEAPESFDYARWSYFNNLTGTGFITDYQILNHKDSNNVNSWRNIIHNKSNSFLTDGLVLGYKNSVPKADKEIWTTAGVGHIWSISGFHYDTDWWLVVCFFLFYLSVHWFCDTTCASANCSNRLCMDCFIFIRLYFRYVCRDITCVFDGDTWIYRAVIWTQCIINA